MQSEDGNTSYHESDFAFCMRDGGYNLDNDRAEQDIKEN